MADEQLSLQALTRKPSAVFSSCGRFRYWLQWPTGLDNERSLLFIGANPSKAGQSLADGSVRCDPTIARMVNLARTLDFGWLGAVNARSFIATDPRDVPPDPEAIGEHTDSWISVAAMGSDLVVCCYGHLAGVRGPRVLDLVRDAGKVPHAIALTKDGLPRHPRGVPSSARPFPMEGT